MCPNIRHSMYITPILPFLAHSVLKWWYLSHFNFCCDVGRTDSTTHIFTVPDDGILAKTETCSSERCSCNWLSPFPSVLNINFLFDLPPYRQNCVREVRLREDRTTGIVVWLVGCLWFVVLIRGIVASLWCSDVVFSWLVIRNVCVVWSRALQLRSCLLRNVSILSDILWLLFIMIRYPLLFFFP